MIDKIMLIMIINEDDYGEEQELTKKTIINADDFKSKVRK